MSGEPGFQRRPLIALVVLASGSILLAAVLALNNPAHGDGSVPDTGSVAVTGHRALLELLESLEIEVQAGPGAWGGKGVLVVLDPEVDLERPATAQRIPQLLVGVGRALVVLPKWTAEADPAHPEWIRRLHRLPAQAPALALAALGLPGTVHREVGPRRIPSVLGGTAELDSPQLLSGSGLIPLVSSQDGVLVGELERGKQKLIVLADPDLLSNREIGSADNARIAVALIQRLHDGAGPVVLEEALLPGRKRGRLPPLLHFPVVLVVAQLLLLALVALWAGLTRFGAPLPDPEQGPHGAAALIEAAVSLQRVAGNAFAASQALLEAAVVETAQRLHAPAGLTGSALDAWLDARAVRTRGDERLLTLRAAVAGASSGHEVLVAAQAVQRWREGMLHGTG